MAHADDQDFSQTPLFAAPPYKSAHDLPSMVDLRRQISILKPFARLLGAAAHREVANAERQLRALCDVVDRFYDVLGPHRWLFTENLPVPGVRALLESGDSGEQAEARFVELVDAQIRDPLWESGWMGHPAMMARRSLIAQARAVYLENHWAACSLLLVTIMDGFVNDVDTTVRRGLHTRSADELQPWDSVTSHHRGLASVMPDFQKSFRRRQDAEVVRLHRHGMVHGMLSSYDNKIVAARAWNMLWAIADWAKAASRPTKLPRTFAEAKDQLWDGLRSAKQYLADSSYRSRYVPRSWAAADPGFLQLAVVEHAKDFFEAWQHKRWSPAARALASPWTRTSPGSRTLVAKGMYEAVALTQFSIDRVDFTMAGGAKVFGTATIDGVARDITTKWLHIRPDGKFARDDETEVRWTLAVYPPDSFYTPT